MKIKGYTGIKSVGKYADMYMTENLELKRSSFDFKLYTLLLTQISLSPEKSVTVYIAALLYLIFINIIPKITRHAKKTEQ